MSSNLTNLSLHEVVLKIMFFENMEKAALMKPEDVLWRIDNPEISERQIHEVLDWLVRQKKAQKYLGKYSIDRIEFLEQKEQYESSTEVSKNVEKAKYTTKKRQTKPKTFYLNPKRFNQSKHLLYLLLLGVLTLSYLTFTFVNLDYKFNPSPNLNKNTELLIDSIIPQKNLYVSNDDFYSKSAKNAISYSFARQNAINNLNVNQFNRLQNVIDSISKSHKKEMLTLQNHLQTNSKNTSSFIKKTIGINVILISIILFFYFKKNN